MTFMMLLMILIGECPYFDGGDGEVLDGSQHVVVVGLRPLGVSVKQVAIEP